MCKCPTIRALSSEEIPPNALRRKHDPNWRGGFSLGVDLGMSRTGLALSKGFSIRPLTVLELRGQKLQLRLIEIAERQEVDEFIIGLPKSCDGKETQQSNKVRSVAGRFAVRAAERCDYLNKHDVEADKSLMDACLSGSNRGDYLNNHDVEANASFMDAYLAGSNECDYRNEHYDETNASFMDTYLSG